MAPKQPTRQEKLQKLYEKLQTIDIGSGHGFLSLKDGKNSVRILPGVGEMEYFFQEVGRHNMPPDGKKYIYCPDFTTNGERPCPICEAVDTLQKSGDPASKALADKLRVKKTFWMNAINRADPSAGPKIFTPGPMIFKTIMSIVQDPDYGDITDPDEGIDLSITKTGSGMDTKYDTFPKRVSPLGTDEEIQDWLEKAQDLTVIEVTDDPDEDAELTKGRALWLYPYERIEREFNMSDVEAAEDEDVEEEQPRKKSKVPSRQAVKPATRKVITTEDEDEEEEEEFEEEEVEAPRTRRTVRH